jgi:hypothetical protein
MSSCRQSLELEPKLNCWKIGLRPSSQMMMISCDHFKGAIFRSMDFYNVGKSFPALKIISGKCLHLKLSGFLGSIVNLIFKN